MRKKLLSVILACSMAVSVSTVAFAEDTVVYAADQNTDSYQEIQTTDGYATNNALYHNYLYGIYASPSNSFLSVLSDGSVMRVEAADGKLHIETYNKTGKLLTSKELDLELPVFGGFYEGADDFYVVTGQENPEESDDVEVLRVTKYDKDWNRLGEASVKGANTRVPFDAGNVAMEESGGSLYIHTCHKMYKLSDGKAHQANMTFAMNEENMKITQQQTEIDNLRVGYVSHSFNQYILIDGDDMYRLDHGDAYPRSVVLTKCDKNNFNEITNYTHTLSITGKFGDNYTGVAVGGMILKNGNIFVAGTSMDQEQDELRGMKNIYVTKTSTDLTHNEKYDLTHHTKEEKILAENPYIINLPDDKMLVIWDEYDGNYSVEYVRAMVINENGEMEGHSVALQGHLSDSKPVLTGDNKLLWYYTQDSSPVFCQLDLEKLQEMNEDVVIPIQKCDVVANNTTMVYKAGTTQEPSFDLYFEKHRLEKDKDYTYKVIGGDNAGEGKVVISGCGPYKGTIEIPFTVKQKEIGSTSISLSNKFFEMDGKAKKPEVTVIDNNIKLQEGTDYKVTYENNVNVGEAHVIIEGIGNYSGTCKLRFYIRPNNDTNDTSAKPSDSGQQIPAQNQKQDKDQQQNSVTKDQQQEEQTEDQPEDDQEFEEDETENINKNTKVSKPARINAVRITVRGKKITVTWSKKKKVDGYQIQYSTNAKFKKGKNTVTKKTKKTSFTIKNTNKKTYYIKVRTYKKVNGKYVYGNWSACSKIIRL